MSDFFDLRRTPNPHRWRLPVTEPICAGPTGAPFLFGGVGLAAAVKAVEVTCARPVMWATAQYLSFAQPPSVVDLDVQVPVTGRHTSQARVVAHVDDREILTVNAALGARPGDVSRQFVAAPQAPPPLECPEVQHWRAGPNDIDARFEKRLVRGRYPDGTPIGRPSDDGRLVVWIRPRERFQIDSAMLAVIADFVSEGISSAAGALSGGNSLDNTIRFVASAPAEWVLCDICIQSIHAGVVHGEMRLFSESGALLAISATSLILRIHKA